VELQEQAFIEQEVSKIELAQCGGFPNEVDPDLPKKIHSLIEPLRPAKCHRYSLWSLRRTLKSGGRKHGIRLP
jgi:hypothetical protein